ncbi:hypothetical protein DM01DRAFT_1313141 [Hesseltinella vesiculosa]|uniref:EB domain-containing protein n=1 Tax=Hesseltinella vesiculosa TaxID=101127 RepID=A0A1X2G2W8_9FUNG|nr:hypothetical protein DM01DRAFT_1313141 [Hesseltinella vesiculosa]
MYLYCEPSTSTCQNVGCANTDYIKGWNPATPFPTRCQNGTFCPDNNSKCTPVVQVGGTCEMQRDDECAGINSICLNSLCNVKGVPLGGTCGNDTTQYVSLDAEQQSVMQTIVRDNCTAGTYCTNAVCITAKALGSQCEQDRECVSDTCSGNVCVQAPDVFRAIEPWLWGVVGAAVVIFILAVLLGLYFLQRYQSKKEREKARQFFGDNEEFAKYAMLEQDDDSCYDETTGLQAPPSISGDAKRQSMVYLTTPDYVKSSALSVGNHSATKLPLPSGSPRASGTFTPPMRHSGSFTPPMRHSGSFTPPRHSVAFSTTRSSLNLTPPQHRHSHTPSS